MENYFSILQKKSPQWSSYIIFSKCLHLTNTRKLRRDFETFVDKEDYARPEKEQILKWLRQRLLSAEENQN